jgi:uncharacterized protein (UPF0147 family)
MAKMSIPIDVTKLDLFKKLLNFLREIVDDQRIPANVREEIMDKFNLLVNEIKK